MDIRRSPPVSDLVQRRIQALGERIRAARVRRGLRREDLAARSGLSLNTIVAIEAGKTGTGIGSYLQALWAMGLGEEVDLLADVGLDRDGLALELNAQTKRVRVKPGVDNDF